MAFEVANLSALAYANGFTQWHYRTGDDKLEVNSLGYFNPADNMIREGDMMIINFTHGYLFHSLGFIHEDEGVLTFVNY